MQDSRESKINLTNQNEQSIPKSELKARLAQVLSRSVVEDRLNIQGIPPEFHHEWVLDDEVEISRKEALGFKLNTEYGAGNALHDDGTGRIKIGDLVSMICTKERKQLLDEIAYERYLETHGPRKKEEKEFETHHKTESKTGPIVDQSKDTKVNAQQIVDSLPKS